MLFCEHSKKTFLTDRTRSSAEGPKIKVEKLLVQKGPLKRPNYLMENSLIYLVTFDFRRSIILKRAVFFTQ